MYTTRAVSLLSRILWVCLWLLPLTPLILLTNATFPFVFPKVFFVATVAGATIIIGVILFILEPTAAPRRDFFLYTLATFILILLISSFFGVDTRRSLWSTFERATGAVFIIYLCGVAVVVGGFLRTRLEKLPDYLLYMCAVSGVVALSALWQTINPAALYNMSSRPSGTLGNPVYLGGYAVMFLLLSAWGIFYYWHRGWRWLALASYALNAVALYLSASRGALLALATVGAAALALHGKKMKIFWHHRLLRVSLIAGVILCVIILWSTRAGYIFQNTLLHRLVTVRPSTITTRIIAWRIAFEGTVERPLLGWGPENFYYVFNAHYNPRSLLFGSYETWFDRVHNATIEMLVTLGVVGLVAYVLQYAALLWLLYKTPRANTHAWWLSATLGGMLVAHFVQNIFAFDHPSSYMVFYLLAGIIAGRAWSLHTQKTTPRWWRVGAGGVAVASFLVWSLFYVPAWRANVLVNQAKIFADVGNPLLAQKTFEYALALNSVYQPEVLLSAARTFNYQTNFAFAEQKFAELLQREPYNVRAHLLQAELFAQAARAGEKKYEPLAEESFARAAQLSPRRQLIWQGWAMYYAQINNSTRALEIITQSINFEPTEPSSHWYASLIVGGTNPARALQELELALRWGYKLTTMSDLIIAAGVYDANNRSGEAVLLLDRALSHSSKNDWPEQLVRLAHTIAIKSGRTDIRAKFESVFPEFLRK